MTRAFRKPSLFTIFIFINSLRPERHIKVLLKIFYLSNDSINLVEMCWSETSRQWWRTKGIEMRELEVQASKRQKERKIEREKRSAEYIISCVWPQKPIKLIIIVGMHWIGKFCVICIHNVAPLYDGTIWTFSTRLYCIWIGIFSLDGAQLRHAYAILTNQTNWTMRHPFYGLVCKFSIHSYQIFHSIRLKSFHHSAQDRIILTQIVSECVV